MKIWFGFLISILFSGAAFSQTVSVRSLFEDTSFLPHVLIPFAITGDLITDGGKLQKISITHASGSDETVDCRGMLDPYNKNVFLVKCTAAATIDAHVEILLAGQKYPVTYTGIQVLSPGAGLVVVEPGTDTGANPADWTAGRNLYNTYCLQCHGSGTQSAKKGATVARIKSGIQNVPTMQTNELQALTDKQLRQIQTYLAKP